MHLNSFSTLQNYCAAGNHKRSKPSHFFFSPCCSEVEHSLGKGEENNLKIINAKNSDLFDVLEYITYAKKPLPRKLRVEKNRDNILNLLNKNQREFVDYVLRNYINEGIDELDISNLSTVLTEKYGSINAAQEKLGNVEDIKNTFVDFQKYLYQEIAA